MHADRKHADWRVDHSIELYHSSRHLVALTRELIEGSEEAIRDSVALLKRTAHKAGAR